MHPIIARVTTKIDMVVGVTRLDVMIITMITAGAEITSVTASLIGEMEGGTEIIIAAVVVMAIEAGGMMNVMNQAGVKIEIVTINIHVMTETAMNNHTTAITVDKITRDVMNMVKMTAVLDAMAALVLVMIQHLLKMSTKCTKHSMKKCLTMLQLLLKLSMIRTAKQMSHHLHLPLIIALFRSILIESSLKS